MLEIGDIRKVQYQCIKVEDPKYTDFQSISDLNIKLVKIGKSMDFIESYSSIIEKKFYKFWDDYSSQANEDFKEYLENIKIKKNKVS